MGGLAASFFQAGFALFGDFSFLRMFWIGADASGAECSSGAGGSTAESAGFACAGEPCTYGCSSGTGDYG